MEVQYLTPFEYQFKYPDVEHYKELCGGYEEFCSSDSSSPYGSGYYSNYSVSYHISCSNGLLWLLFFCSTLMMTMMMMVTIGNITNYTLAKTVQYYPASFLIPIICCYRRHCHFTQHRRGHY